jgi:hypothetical protein
LRSGRIACSQTKKRRRSKATSEPGSKRWHESSGAGSNPVAASIYSTTCCLLLAVEVNLLAWMGRCLNVKSVGLGARCAVLLACIGAGLVVGVLSLLAASAPMFSHAASYATGVDPWAVAIGDLDGDGAPDLVLATGTQNLDTVSVLLNKGTGEGTFYGRQEYLTGSGTRAAVIGDLNGDGQRDIVTANADANTVSVLLNSERGKTFDRKDYATGPAPVSVAIGDLSGGGHLEVVTANSESDTVSVLLNRGDGSFQPKRDYRTGRHLESVAIGNLNGDRAPDIATANRSDTVSVLLNRGDGSFPSHVEHPAGSGPISIAIGDLNGDRHVDLVTANHHANGVESLSVLLNRGDGSFQPKRDYRDPVADCFCSHSVGIGDLNGDGKPELVVADERSDLVFLNKGRGSFQPRLKYEAGPDPFSVALGDLNRDGTLDLVTANSDSNTVSVLLHRTGLCVVPKVVGKTLATAKRTIEAAHCRVGKISRAYSKIVAAGRVISEHPRPGTTLPRAAKIDLVVSRGR